MVTLGIEHLVNEPPASLAGKRLGLLVNQASTDSSFRPSHELIARSFPGQLSCLFSPQHGFMAEKQDNMVESSHATMAGLPLFSLYGLERKPTAEMMAELDVLLIDLVDVGTRVYTFMYTVAYCLEAAAEQGKEVVILDRPNPIGGALVEGNILRDHLHSFVGLYPIPMRHGLTLGELALFFNRYSAIGADLSVIKMSGWQRGTLFPQTGLPWLFPSPNMPAFNTALVYPGQVIWEGTNISEGRGTSLPFELCGAPFVEPDAVLAFLAAARTPLPGCLLRPLFFEPTFHKWAGETCGGFQIHVTDPDAFRPYRTSLALLQAISRLYPDEFAYKEPPYEYEFDKLPLDLILGDSDLRQALAAGGDIMELEAAWMPELNDFLDKRRQVLLYD
ncbi:MAG: DUF1343 domain-containing protein [Thermodesulfobacteriota bacterium]